MSLKPEQVTQVQALAVQAMAGILLKAMVSDAMEFDPSCRKAVVTIQEDSDGSLIAFCEYMAGREGANAVLGGHTL